MFFLLITVCTSTAMDDCWVRRLGDQYPTFEQCMTVQRTHAAVLGSGPDQNYYLECVEEKP